MKLGFSFIAALLLTTGAFAQQAATTTTTDPTQDPTAVGNAFFKAMLDEDGPSMGKLLASDFSITSFDGQSVDGDLLMQGVGGGMSLSKPALSPILKRASTTLTRP